MCNEKCTVTVTLANDLLNLLPVMMQNSVLWKCAENANQWKCAGTITKRPMDLLVKSVWRTIHEMCIRDRDSN